MTPWARSCLLGGTSMGSQWSAVQEAYDRVEIECCRTRDDLKHPPSSLVDRARTPRGFASTPRSVDTASTTPRGIVSTPRDTSLGIYSRSSHLASGTPRGPSPCDSPRTQMLAKCFECQKRPVTTVCAGTRLRTACAGRRWHACRLAALPAHVLLSAFLRRGFRKGPPEPQTPLARVDACPSSRGWNPAATCAYVQCVPPR